MDIRDDGNKDHHPNNQNGGWGSIFRVIAVGAVIVWLLGVSTNGIFTFFSDSPGFQLYPFFVFASIGIWYLAFHIALRLRDVPWIFMVASAVCCLLFVVTTKMVDRKIEQLSRPPLGPHFIWSLRIDPPGSSLLLTNDCLFGRTFKKAGDLPNGEILNAMIPAVLIAPVRDEESNKVLTLTMDSRSLLAVKDPEFMVGFPTEWKIGIDSNKWKEVDAAMILQKMNSGSLSKFTPSNVQYFAASKPMTLSPFDTIELPAITNFSPLQIRDNSLKGGLIEVAVRVPEFNSRPYEELLSANFFFVPAQSNFSKAAIVCCKIAPDGTLIWPTEQEVEATQK